MGGPGVIGLAAVLALAATASQETYLYPAIFTPDGTGIVVPTMRGSLCFLYRADVETGVTRRVTSAPDGCESEPAFSPDGQRLVFLRIARAGEHAYLMDARADGTDERILVTNQTDNLNPQFVPHRNEVVYLRSNSLQRPQHKFDVYAVDLTTRETKRLTHQEYYRVFGLSVSRDGRQLLLGLSDTSGTALIVSSIDSADKPIQRLRPNPFASVSDAEWMPDGRSVLFTGGVKAPNGDGYDYNVYRLTLATGDIVPLTRFVGAFTGYSVSNDGTKIVALYRNNYYIIDLETRRVTPVPLKLQR